MNQTGLLFNQNLKNNIIDYRSQYVNKQNDVPMLTF